MPDWFVKNVAEASAIEHPRGGITIGFESREDKFPELGVNIRVLAPGQPAGQYHAESAQEGSDPREAYADWGADFKPVQVDWPPR